MPSVANISRDVRPFMNKRKTLVRHQSVNDIIGGLMDSHIIDAGDYDNISKDFWRGNVRDTAAGLFDFCKKHIRYKIEPDASQTVRSPGAIMAMKSGDCKHYASFINGVLQSLKRKGYPVDSLYRFANYKTFQRDPHHVFAVARDPANGKEYWVDPVLRFFDQRKPYNNAVDKKPDNTMLQRVSGVGYDGLPSIGRKSKAQRQQKKAARKQKRATKKAARKERRANRPGIFKKAALAVPRNAFLLMLKMNLFKKASQIFQKVNKDAGKKKALLDKWKKLGGNPNVLWKNIMQGVRVYNKHHKGKKLSGIAYVTNAYGWDTAVSGVFVPGMGVVPFAGAAAAIAAAVPIIKALKPLLASFGIQTDDIKEGADPGDAANVTDMQEEAGGGYEDSGVYDEDPGELDNTAGEDYADQDLDMYDGMDEGEIEEYGGEIGAVVKKKKLKKAIKKTAATATAAAKTANNLFGKKPATASPNAQQANKIKQRTININLPAGAKKPAALPKKPVKIPSGNKAAVPAGSPPGTIPGTTQDNTGISDFFNEAKQWVSSHKMEVGIAAAGIAIPLIFNAFNSRTKRRR